MIGVFVFVAVCCTLTLVVFAIALPGTGVIDDLNKVLWAGIFALLVLIEILSIGYFVERGEWKKAVDGIPVEVEG